MDEGTDSIRIESSAVSHDVPFGDCFTIEEQITLTNSATGVLVKKAFRNEFTKKCIKGQIESATAVAQRRSCDVLLTVLQSYANNKDMATAASSSTISAFDEDDSLTTPTDALEDLFNSALESQLVRVRVHDAALPRPFTVASVDSTFAEVWELQRRSSRFHSDWCAPFKRHDKQKRVRWVDSEHLRHQWIVKPTKEAAACDTPPLEPPAGWRDASSGWSVLGRSSDPKGWQYADDFYVDDARWSEATLGFCCRRRLWQCELLRAPTNAQPRSRLVDIWELQRRTTLFSNSWYAPFLPHDRIKRWRWVDKDYIKHPWTVGSKEAASIRDEPPLEAPTSWRKCGAWVIFDPVSKVSGTHNEDSIASKGVADGEGWEYAPDFHRSNTFWSTSHISSISFHCRRRLWRCHFEEELTP
jgi:hypothetical protein